MIDGNCWGCGQPIGLYAVGFKRGEWFEWYCARGCAPTVTREC